MTSRNEKRLYRVNEFLAAFGIGRTKFYSEVRAGRLRIVRLGERATRVLVEDAERWAQGLAPALTPSMMPIVKNQRRPTANNKARNEREKSNQAKEAERTVAHLNEH